MALTERISPRESLTPPYFNEDGSYTRLGVQMEISKHIIRVPNHPSVNLIAEARGMKIVPRFPEMPQGIALLSNPNVKTHEKPARHGQTNGRDAGKHAEDA